MFTFNPPENELAFSLYPNPSSENLSSKRPMYLYDSEITIFNYLGERIKKLKMEVEKVIRKRPKVPSIFC